MEVAPVNLVNVKHIQNKLCRTFKNFAAHMQNIRYSINEFKMYFLMETHFFLFAFIRKEGQFLNKTDDDDQEIII
jgi:hypothetical protein